MFWYFLPYGRTAETKPLTFFNHALSLTALSSERAHPRQLKTAKQPQLPVNSARLIWAGRTGILRKLQRNLRKTRKLSSQATQQASLLWFAFRSGSLVCCISASRCELFVLLWRHERPRERLRHRIYLSHCFNCVCLCMYVLCMYVLCMYVCIMYVCLCVCTASLV